MATSYKWTINQGQDETLTVTFKDADGNAVDLDDASITSELQIRSAYTSSSAAVTMYSAVQKAVGTVTVSSLPVSGLATNKFTGGTEAGRTAACKVTVEGVSSNGTTIALISTDGTSVTYTCQAANSYSSQQFRGSAGSTTEIATALKGAIEDSNGHNGKILVSQASNVLTLTQAVSGEAGNTTVTESMALSVAGEEADRGDSVTLISQDGTSKKYVFQTGGTTGNTDGSDVIVDLKDSAELCAAELATAIASSPNGHQNAKLTTSRSGGTLTITNATGGSAGNTTITETGSSMTVSNFTGGYDSEISMTDAGVVTVSLSDTNTAALSAPANYVYDLELTGYPSAGKKYRLLEGTINVRPEVTK